MSLNSYIRHVLQAGHVLHHLQEQEDALHPQEPSQKQCSKSCRPVGRDADQELGERKETSWDMMITTFLGTRPCGKEAVVASSLG